MENLRRRKMEDGRWKKEDGRWKTVRIGGGFESATNYRVTNQKLRLRA
jgi:hypothetical protein